MNTNFFFLFTLLLNVITCSAMEHDQLQKPHEIVRNYFQHDQLAQWVQNSESRLIIPHNISAQLFLLDQKPSIVSQAHEYFSSRLSKSCTLAPIKQQLKLVLKGSCKESWCTAEQNSSDEQLVGTFKEQLRAKLEGSGSDNEKLVCALMLHDAYAVGELLKRGASGDFSSEEGDLFNLTSSDSAAFYMAEMVRHYELLEGSCDHTRWQSIFCKLLQERPQLFTATRTLFTNHVQLPISLLQRSHNRFVGQERTVLTGYEIVKQNKHFSEDTNDSALEK